MSVTTSRALRVVACAASAWLVIGCGHKKHDTGVSAGGDGAMPLEDAGVDAGKKVAIPPKMTPVQDAGHDAGPQGGGGTTGSDEDAGPSCDHAACRATSDECNLAYCDKQSGACKLAPRTDDTACGSRTLDNCTTPDSCVSGVCVPNDSAKGTPCGDQGKDCNYDDACDGKGSCADKGVWNVGTACGDKTTNTACDAADTCDASGVCQNNYAVPNAPCGDQGKLCSYDDACDGQGHCIDNGVWTLGECPPGSKDEPAEASHAAGCLCGGEILGICRNAIDVCVAGTCVSGAEPDGKSCGSSTTNTECDKPDVCTGGTCVVYVQAGMACGNSTPDTTCNRADVCDGAGHCDSNYASTTTACGSAAGECYTEPLCNGAGGCTPSVPLPSGTSCGSQVDNDCNQADTCDGAGVCLDHLAASGSACGSGTNSECDKPDTCDGAGVCLSNFVASGSACGDQGKTCLRNDACDGSGACTDEGLAVPCAFHGSVLGNSSGLPGVLVETLGSSPVSATTTQNGTFNLGVRAFGELLFHVADASGYYGDVELRTLAPQDAAQPLDFNLLPDGNLNVPAAAVVLGIDATQGVVLVTIDGSTVTGSEGASLSAASAMPIANVNGTWQYSTSIASSGGGQLLFYNVAVGATSVSPISAGGETCTVDATSIAQFPVLAHTLTRVHITCH